jgi:uncharacterized membrane protein
LIPGVALGNFEHVNTGAIIIIAIAASGVLMMRFRKRWLAKFNIAVTNRITGLFAGWLPGFGILAQDALDVSLATLPCRYPGKRFAETRGGNRLL